MTGPRYSTDPDPRPWKKGDGMGSGSGRIVRGPADPRVGIENVRLIFDPPEEFWERRRAGFWARARRYVFDVLRAVFEQLAAILWIFAALFELIASLVEGDRREAGAAFLRSLLSALVRFDKLVGSIVLGTPWDLTISAWLGFMVEFRGGPLIVAIAGFLHILDENHVQKAAAKAERLGRFLDRHQWAGSIFFVFFLWGASFALWILYR